MAAEVFRAEVLHQNYQHGSCNTHFTAACYDILAPTQT